AQQVDLPTPQLPDPLQGRAIRGPSPHHRLQRRSAAEYTRFQSQFGRYPVANGFDFLQARIEPGVLLRTRPALEARELAVGECLRPRHRVEQGVAVTFRQRSW